MMNFRIYIIVLISCYIFLNCNDNMNEPSNMEVYYGDVYIACDDSPHYVFLLDSLILNCNAASFRTCEW